MRALLLAAGLGTRLRPITNSIPKCLVPIHGRALIDYWFDLLAGADINPIIVNTHYFADKVTAHVGASVHRERITLVHEPDLLGTGGTMVAQRHLLEAQPFLMAHADNLTDFDVSGMMEAHAGRPANVAITMLAFQTDDPQSCGILECVDNLVVQFHEKVENPPGNLANAAVYIIEPEVLDFAVGLNRAFVDFSTDVIPHFMGRIQMFETKGYHRDIGNPRALELAHLEFPKPRPTPAAS